ncbi:MAG: TatD family hydrolase [Kineosporiaceae bacterium]
MPSAPALPPEPLPHPVVDNHTHLEHARGEEVPVPLDVALAAAAGVGVTRVVQIGDDVPTSRWSVEAAQSSPAVLAGVALHPTEATRLLQEEGRAAYEAAWSEIARLAEHPRVVVVGETGIDHYWVGEDDEAGRAIQEESFRRHIDLAKRLGKVLQIHDRDAHASVLRILEEEGAPERTVFHCFSGDAEMARHCLDRGWFLSFAGTVTFKNAEPLREALRLAPADAVLLETDAPYLAPVPHRGRSNSSALLPWTVRATAEVRGVDLAEWCERIDATSQAVYGPW